MPRFFYVEIIAGYSGTSNPMLMIDSRILAISTGAVSVHDASPLSRSTVTDETPGTLETASVTDALQWLHVMPWTLIVGIVKTPWV